MIFITAAALFVAVVGKENNISMIGKTETFGGCLEDLISDGAATALLILGSPGDFRTKTTPVIIYEKLNGELRDHPVNLLAFVQSEADLLRLENTLGDEEIAPRKLFVKFGFAIASDRLHVLLKNFWKRGAFVSFATETNFCCFRSALVTGNCQDVTCRKFEKHEEFKRRAFSGCSLRATWIKKIPFADEPGVKTSLYGGLFDAIQSKSGVQMMYEHEEALQEDFDLRGSFENAGERLVRGKIDVILGQTLVNAAPHVEFGPVFYSDMIFGIAPKPQSLKVHRNLFKIFSPQLYASFSIAHVIVIIFYCVITKDHFRFRIGLISRYRSLLVLFSFYFVFRIILEAAYVGKLSSVFGTPSKTIKVTDVITLYVHEFHVYKTWYVKTVTTGRYVITNEDWGRKFLHNVNESEKALIELAADAKNYAISIVFKSGCKTYPSQVMAADTFNFIPGANYYDTFYLRRGNFLNEVVKYWAQEIIERGLFEKWWDDLILSSRNFSVERSAVETNNDEAVAAAFTLSHYQEVFGVLLVGEAGALMIFALEFGAKMIERKIERMKRYSPL